MKLKKPLICVRIVVISTTFLVSITTLFSQNFSAAIVAGMNACQIDGDQLAGFDQIGFTGGIKAIYNFDSPFDLNVEFLYSQRGSQPSIFNPNYDPNIQIKLSYAELPVYFTLGDWYQEKEKFYKVSAQAGLSYGRLINASADDYYHPPGMSVDNLVPYFNNNDLSWLIGATYMFNKSLGITGRYTRGITPLFSPDKHGLEGQRLLSYFITFRLEYYF